MEYLMTYGWAILLLVIVIYAILDLGIFNQQQHIHSECTSLTGYNCGLPVYSHTTGNLTVLLTQSTGTTWDTANVYFVPIGTPTPGGVPSSIINNPANGNYLKSGLPNGIGQTVIVPVSSPLNTPVGEQQDGALWAAYQLAPNAKTYYIEVATMVITAS